MYHTVFHLFSLFPNCLRFLDNLCIIYPIRFEHLDHVIKTDQSESVNFASFIGRKKKQIPDFSLSDWPVSGHMIFFSKKNLFFLHFSYVFPHFSPPLLHPSTLAAWSWHFYFMSSVFNCRSLNVRCTYLLFSSCPLFFPVVYFMSSVFTCPFLPVHCSLALTLDIGMKLRNVSKARH